jgi:hypothetical protein
LARTIAHLDKAKNLIILVGGLRKIPQFSYEGTAMHPAQYVRRKEAAQYLRAKFGVGSPATLAKLATLGGGPIFRKMGRIPVYVVEDLDAWALAKIGAPRKSTSEASGEKRQHSAEQRVDGV